MAVKLPLRCARTGSGSGWPQVRRVNLDAWTTRRTPPRPPLRPGVPGPDLHPGGHAVELAADRPRRRPGTRPSTNDAWPDLRDRPAGARANAGRGERPRTRRTIGLVLAGSLIAATLASAGTAAFVLGTRPTEAPRRSRAAPAPGRPASTGDPDRPRRVTASWPSPRRPARRWSRSRPRRAGSAGAAAIGGHRLGLHLRRQRLDPDQLPRDRGRRDTDRDSQ